MQAAISNFQGEGPRRLETMELEMSKMDNRTPRFLKRQEETNNNYRIQYFPTTSFDSNIPRQHIKNMLAKLPNNNPDL